jgi:hypothetical protein
MAEFKIDNGYPFMEWDIEPTLQSGGSFLFVRKRAERLMWSQLGPSGVGYSFQPSLFSNKVGWWNPPGNATTVPGILGIAALTATGTVTGRNVATTNLFTRIRRLSLVSGATAGQLCGYRNTVAQFTVGDSTTLGGFFYVVRFGIADATNVAGARMFIGLRNITTAGTNVEPSTITNCIGVGHGASNTNLFIYYGGSAAQTPINLGANFPTNTQSTDMYELTLFSWPSSNNEVGYRVERLNTGDVASGTLTGTAGVALPASTTLLRNNDFRTNNATATAVAIDYASIYFETDN